MRIFPIHNESDTNDHPTGGTRKLVYGLYPGEAMWQLEVEGAETMDLSNATSLKGEIQR